MEAPTVLLLEDEFLIALELEEALEDAGFRVLSASASTIVFTASRQ
ncbi:hypothetical protein KX729_25480 [Rhizobium sp. XQZ8]|nr:hypothetical protein [Rhizobium populisoli]MBW6424808.1 hypothetical protein [Rhizobium populisoli]